MQNRLSRAAMLTVTFIRHGESADNLKFVWSGWKDSQLSNHGMNQAKALGKAFSKTKLDAIYTSDLLRARMTAQALRDAQPDPASIMFHVSELLREQNFGIAEGKAWRSLPFENMTLEEHYAKGIYPSLEGRDAKFIDGECRNDVFKRTSRAIDELIVPHLQSLVTTKEEGHVAVVSHGLCIAEMVNALMERNASIAGHERGERWRGLSNTAWTRVVVEFQGSETSELDANGLPPLHIHVTHINQQDHLRDVKRQGGGIGSGTYDPTQQDIRAFFGGGAARAKKEQEPSESNAHDRVDDQK